MAEVGKVGFGVGVLGAKAEGIRACVRTATCEKFTVGAVVIAGDHALVVGPDHRGEIAVGVIGRVISAAGLTDKEQPANAAGALQGAGNILTPGAAADQFYIRDAQFRDQIPAVVEVLPPAIGDQIAVISYFKELQNQ